MTPKAIKMIGECLHGTRWQGPLSRQMGVHINTVNQGWMKKGCPDYYKTQLSGLLRAKEAEIRKARLLLRTVKG